MKYFPIFIMNFLILFMMGCGDEITPVRPALKNLEDVISVKAGFQHTCVLLSTGGVMCWGRNNQGQIGNPDIPGTPSETGVAVPVFLNELGDKLEDAVEVSAGGLHSCSRSVLDEVRCWGANFWGQLANNSKDNALFPVFVGGDPSSPASDLVGLSLGTFHTCFLHPTGSASCAGQWAHGQLGNGLAFDAILNTTVRGFGGDGLLTGNEKISAGYEHTCSVRLISAGVREVWCWGENNEGQLGVFSPGKENYPVPVTVDEQIHLTGVIDVSTGGYHSCAIMEDKTARCWGSNEYGQIGTRVYPDESDFGFAHVVLETLGGSPLSNIEEIASGVHHNCARLTDETVRCWGRNDRGQLGNLATEDSTQPRTVLGLNNVVGITAGGFHSCALTAQGRVYCWGDNRYSQISSDDRSGGEFFSTPQIINEYNE